MKQTARMDYFRGRHFRSGLGKVIMLVLLIDVAFIFMLPMLKLFSQSLMDIMDLYDPTVAWLPKKLMWSNYINAFKALEYSSSLKQSIYLAGGSAILQTISCAVVGYGFARFKFPGRDKIFGLVLFCLIVPPHAIIIQLFILFSKLQWVTNMQWLNTLRPFLIPAALGMGLRGALFIFIYRQFFKGLPYELEDAAMIDGAGPFRIFFGVMLPLAKPVILVVFLFSFVWNWNNSLETSIYMSKPVFLPQQLSNVESALSNLQLRGMWGTGTVMSATLLVILPLILLYIFTQRNFVESIDRTGLID